MFFNKRRRRKGRHGGAQGGGDRREEAEITPPLPQGPLPQTYAANVFGLLDEKLQYALGDAGYAIPTPIQEQAIPKLLEGCDLMGCAQTGTGKTAAFMLPILQRLLSWGPAPKPSVEEGGKKTLAGHPRALVLSPTRELAAQTAENTAKFSRYVGTRFATVFGGVSQFPQVKALQKGADIVIATPGRLIDLMTQGVVYLDRVRLFVLDEADRMLDMGFFPDIRRIVSKLPPPNRKVPGADGRGEEGRQSMFFSATLSPEIRALAGELVVDPVQITISPGEPAVEKIAQSCMFVEKGNKDNLLIHLLQTKPEWFRVIVFARTRHGADRIERKLKKQDIPVAALHSDKTQGQRTRALKAFREGKLRVLVATDIASRGIDVPDIDAVVNMELPVESESYVHRIGRTARAGGTGAAVSFVAPEERNLLRGVERYIRKPIPVDRDHPYHSEEAERRAGKSGQGLPQAPWIRGGMQNRNGFSRHPGARFFPGKRKGGFGGGMRHDGAPPAKKKIHPANVKRPHRGRPNFQGRREPDFGGR